jgi:hypothetical protein
MNTNDAEASREAIWAILVALDKQHKVAVEAGNQTLSEAILVQTEALYEEAIRKGKEGVENARELAEAHSTLFVLKVKGAKTRMKHRMAKLNTAAAA